MRGDVLWPLLFGSALTLVTTLLAQWFSLDFQTKRQREARRADFQRSTLLQLRDGLGELDDAIWGLLRARHDACENESGWMGLPDHHPSFEAVTRAGSRLLMLVTGVEDKLLFEQVFALVQSSQLVADAVGEQLRSLP